MSEMEYIYPDERFTHYEQGYSKDEANFEYRWCEADGFNIGELGWRETLERLAQEKLTRLRQRDPTWEPFLVIRDSIIGTDSEPDMRPLAFSFRRKKVLPIPVC
ncbi:MAG: hypothetical protein E8D46_09460 [Nitrospira sp.]|nr:hypothetical protein [Nitrospira sp.]TKB74082.1 MAG: hypothetical protein E8D46_09460 [Nitrospira sp.]